MSGVSAFSVLRNRDFFLYSSATLLAAFAAEILVIAIGWQIYDITGNAADLGLLGLVQFLPNCVLVLVTGTVADRYSRKLIVTLCMLAELVFIVAIFLVT